MTSMIGRQLGGTSIKGRTQIATAMPCVEVNRRCDMTLDPLIAVTRPVGREEMITNRDANRAMKQQWSVMHRRAWNFGEVRERCEVIKEAQDDNREIRLGRIHGLCIETNSELPPGHPARQYRGHILFTDCGDDRNVHRDINHTVSPDLSAAQVSFENQRLVDCFGACPGNESENADGVQIYSQVPLRGTPYWIELPTEAGLGAIWGPKGISEANMGHLVALGRNQTSGTTTASHGARLRRLCEYVG